MIEVEEYEDWLQTIIVFKEVVGGPNECLPNIWSTHHTYITYIWYIHNICDAHIIDIYDTDINIYACIKSVKIIKIYNLGVSAQKFYYITPNVSYPLTFEHSPLM